MENSSFRNYSLLGLALMGVSALTAAMIPSKAKSEAASQGRLPNNGHSVQSTVNNRQTASVPSTVSSQVGGNRSWTTTGLPGDEFDEDSATSQDVFDDTNTAEISWATADATTSVGHENLDPA
ncbi:hypothetical protein AAHN97_26845 [Chitinophaga niabensis]|uniref:hypothetical protein n=1 Tax=Chitinophaga niabensis TaxID=536979 RepID=UPI0031BACAB5